MIQLLVEFCYIAGKARKSNKDRIDGIVKITGRAVGSHQPRINCIYANLYQSKLSMIWQDNKLTSFLVNNIMA